MKLEVGMYVRTNNSKEKPSRIGKITNIRIDRLVTWYEIDNHEEKCWVGAFIKASHNIKELLQVGDFVDYEYPTGLGMWYYKNVEITEHLLNVFKNGENNHEYKIKSIVTREQFEQMQYKVSE